MHRTETIDYGIVLSGLLDLVMEDGTTVHLEPGDCIVQLGGTHEWRNVTTAPATLAFVAIGVNPGGMIIRDA